MGDKALPESLVYKPVTVDEWEDMQELFSQGHVYECRGCWCMYWRLTRAEHQRQGGEGNRLAMERVIQTGTVPGILAYLNGEPIGW
jgi:hypothetical protein